MAPFPLITITASQHFQLRAAFDLVEHLGVLIGSLADIQPSAVSAVDEERLSGIGGGRGGENGNHEAQGHQNNNGDAENLFHGRLPSFHHPIPVCGGAFIHWSGVIVLTPVDTENMDGWQLGIKNLFLRHRARSVTIPPRTDTHMRFPRGSPPAEWPR